MINMNFGYVKNIKSGVVKDIIVKTAIPNKVKDIVIGGGMVLAGIGWLTIAAFKDGAVAHENAEYKALNDAGLIGGELDENGDYTIGTF